MIHPWIDRGRYLNIILFVVGGLLSIHVSQVNEHMSNYQKAVLLIVVKVQIHMNGTRESNDLGHGEGNGKWKLKKKKKDKILI